MLGSDEKIAWSLREDGLAVTSPSSPPHEMAVVYKIETNGIQHFQTPAGLLTQNRPPSKDTDKPNTTLRSTARLGLLPFFYLSFLILPTSHEYYNTLSR
jgi:hypothetical protein